MRIPTYLFRDKVTIEVYLGETAYGPQYGPPQPTRCRFHNPRTQNGKRGDQQGKERVNKTFTVYFPAGTIITEKSKVTFGKDSYEVKDAAQQRATLLSHVEARLGDF